MEAEAGPCEANVGRLTIKPQNKAERSMKRTEMIVATVDDAQTIAMHVITAVERRLVRQSDTIKSAAWYGLLLSEWDRPAIG